MARLNVGLIGLGAMGRNHARVLSGLEGISFNAIFDEDPSKKTEFPDKFKSSLHEFYESDLDYVVIATPTSSHEFHANMAIQAGVHFFVEKPLSQSTEISQKILSFAKSNSIIGGVGHIERYNSALMEAKRIIHSGVWGEILQINFQRHGPRPDRIKDVGVLLDLASHDFDSLLYLDIGNPTSLYASAITLSSNGLEDSVEILGKIEGKVNFSMSINWISAKKKRLCTITTTKGLVEIDTLSASLSFYGNGTLKNTQKELSHFFGDASGESMSYAFEKREALLVEHESFRDKILGESNKIVSLEDGLKTLSLIEAASQSIVSKKVEIL